MGGTRTASYEAPRLTEHLLPARAVDQVFRIKVQQPMRRADGSERFPVLYATDSDDFFGGFAAMSNIMQTLGEAPRFVLVGIGYENARAAEVLRMRDLLPSGIRAFYRPMIEQLASSALVEGIDDLSPIMQTTDAGDFLRFIRDELMPYINAHYPTLPHGNSYFGYSAGGTFGLYAMFTRPDSFGRYMLGSPATSYAGQHFGIQLARDFRDSGRSMAAKVFISVGELEEFKRGCGQLDLVSGYYLMVKFLKEAAIPGLDLTARVFPGETHATAWTAAFSHGLRAVHGSGEEHGTDRFEGLQSPEPGT